MYWNLLKFETNFNGIASSADLSGLKSFSVLNEVGLRHSSTADEAWYWPKHTLHSG